MRKLQTGSPRCPNHGCRLEIDVKDRNKTRGQGKCPVSGALFAWTQQPEAETKKLDKFGNVITDKTFLTEGED